MLINFNYFLFKFKLILIFNIFIFLLFLIPYSFQQHLFASTNFCEQFPGDSLCQQFIENNKKDQIKKFCNYQDLWLIPGRADASCTRQNSKRLVEMDAKQVKISPSIIKFPGCFTIEIKNVNIIDNNGLPNSIFAKTEYQWLNVQGSEKAKCQNSSLNGCGGFGNNCYYCDICESLNKVFDKEKNQIKKELPSNIAQQLKGIKCPSEPGLYTFKKQFCFNDWKWLDNDGDCRLDILSETEDDPSGIKMAMSALQQVGYGTVVTKIRLAFNATPEIERKKAIKEEQIERNYFREFNQRNKNLDTSIREWYILQQKSKWHKNDYLPWLLYENEFACIKLTFDVCERQPQKRWEGRGYTCV